MEFRCPAGGFLGPSCPGGGVMPQLSSKHGYGLIRPRPEDQPQCHSRNQRKEAHEYQGQIHLVEV
jgi:hypothetical protein